MSTPEPRPEPELVGLDRDGHLTELGLMRYLFGEASAATSTTIEAHASTCSTCRELLHDLRHNVTAQPIPLLPAKLRLAQARAAPRPERPAWLLRAVPLLAAAVVLVVALGVARHDDPAGGREMLTPRGSDLGFIVHVHDGTTSRVVDSGALVSAGDRARFEIDSVADAYLLIAGIDDHGMIYAGFPQGDGTAVFMPGSPSPRALPTAIEFDGELGREHLFAMACDHPFGLDDMKPAMIASLGSINGVVAPSGCTLRRVDLEKAPPL